MRHLLRLHDQHFQNIVGGSKIIESRLYDEKRRLITAGDEIVFTNRSDENQIVAVQVSNLLLFPTFRELFSSREPREFGEETIEQLENSINQFYSPDEQAIYGVVGIEFKILQ